MVLPGAAGLKPLGACRGLDHEVNHGGFAVGCGLAFLANGGRDWFEFSRVRGLVETWSCRNLVKRYILSNRESTRKWEAL
jgi:hypothetical protein